MTEEPKPLVGDGMTRNVVLTAALLGARGPEVAWNAIATQLVALAVLEGTRPDKIADKFKEIFSGALEDTAKVLELELSDLDGAWQRVSQFLEDGLEKARERGEAAARSAVLSSI